MNIAVIVTTYYPEGPIGAVRLEHTKEVLGSLSNLYPINQIIVSDDGSHMRHEVSKLDLYANNVKIITGPNAGVGASINRALLYLQAQWNLQDWVWIYLPDDLMLTKELDLTQAIKLIELGYDFVRLDLPHPNLLCKTKFQQDIGWYLDLDLRCEYSFATRPTLISSKFSEKIGPFKEFADSYLVELDYSHRVSDQMLYSAGAISCDLGNAWEHCSDDNEEVGKFINPLWINHNG